MLSGLSSSLVAVQVGAPLRPVTVRDAIGDLPAIENGHSVEEMEYVSEPVRSRVRMYVVACSEKGNIRWFRLPTDGPCA